VNLNIIPPILAGVACLLVAFFVYSKDKLNPINRSFAIMLLCVSIWNVNWAMIIGGQNPGFIHIWAGILRPAHLFIPPTFLHFAILFTNPRGISQKNKQILIIFYAISCFLSAISWTDAFHGDLIANPWGYSFKSGPLYKLYLLQFIIAIVVSFGHMIRGYVRADRYYKQKLKYFFLATGVSIVMGSLNFLPVLGFKIYPIGSFGTSIGLFFMSYSIVQHRLMDVSIFMAKGLSYIFSLMILAIPSFLIIGFLENSFHQRIEVSFVIILTLLGAIAILLFGLIKKRMDEAMHEIIVRDKYKYHEILEEFGRRLVTIVDLNRLLQMLADTIEKSMGITQISIFLREPDRDEFQPHLIRGDLKKEPLKISDGIIQFLQGKKEAVLSVELEGEREGSVEREFRKIMGQVGGEVCLPLIYSNRLIGFINLGSKAPQGFYYAEDLTLLNSLANQVAIAIENANLYENLKRSQGVMRRADRLASLGTLIASLAHEIRNPLVSIKTFTQLLPERIDDEEFRNYFLRVASAEIDRLTGLINELLGFARPSEPRPQGEDINDLIDKMEVLVSTEARKKSITLSKKYTLGLPQVKVDAEQIKQVLLNILLNAIQAIKDEGQIWIETRPVQVPLEDRVGNFIQVEIRDTGVGIPQENLERIFDPFFSTRPDGSGLGLAISHQIIHEHGGFINVDSQVGKGTSFKVHLPLKAGGKDGTQGE